jgi:hypothetical protein
MLLSWLCIGTPSRCEAAQLCPPGTSLGISVHCLCSLMVLMFSIAPRFARPPVHAYRWS